MNPSGMWRATIHLPDEIPAEPFEEGCALGVAHRHADAGPLGRQVLDDLAPEES